MKKITNLILRHRAKLRFVTLCLFCFFIGAGSIFAQNTVTGTVSDETGPLPGVSVFVKGTNNGIMTTADGKYNLSVPSDAVLVFSFMGFTTQEIAVGNRTTLDVKMVLDHNVLEEVVVVGYGSMKVKDLTSAVTTIKGDDIAKSPAGQAMQAMQGKVAGMQVVSSGNPGSAPTVRIRGIGSYPVDGNTNPLYVVDGVFYSDISFLNSADIASMSVLKDASAAAIYGVRAANGVILVETKSGGFDRKTEITFDGYAGIQRAQNVLKMANSEQFTTFALESGAAKDASYVENAMIRYGRSRVNPNVPDVNTDWYKEILRVAPVQNYSLDVSGGTSKLAYSVGGNYRAEEGILNTESDFKRFNLRSKLDFKATEWLAGGANFLFSQITRHEAEAGAWNAAYFAVPILPVYDYQNVKATPTPYSDARVLGYRDNQNPFPSMDNRNNLQETKKLFTNFYLEATLIPKKLTFKTSYSNNYSSGNTRTVLLPYFVTDNFKRLDTQTNVAKTYSTTTEQTWDNVLTYTDTYAQKHNLTAMLGSSYRHERWTELSANANNLLDWRHEEAWYIGLTNVEDRSKLGYSDNGTRQYAMSYFGRIAYNYDDRYLLYGTLRADGTSKYQTKWGYFPTVGAGWVITGESFMSDVKVIDYLKLRGSWGKLGNNGVPASDGAQTTSLVNFALNDVLTSGTTTSGNYAVLGWEVVEETNIGLTSRFLQNRLSMDAEYFVRDTKNAVIPNRIPGTNGYLRKNTGVIRNSGFELTLNWSDSFANKEVQYSVGVNIATLKNEARELGGQQYIDGGSAEFRQRTIVGQPLLAFFGYEVAGVYQNEAEIQADPMTVGNDIKPGYFKYRDQNGDGVLGAEDRVVLGSYLPKFTYGANLAIAYKGFELAASFYGQAGNKILNRKRGQYVWTNDTNVDADLAVNRWHGEGTSNKYPSSAGLREAWNIKPLNSYYIESGSFFRIQNVQLAYNIKNQNWFGAKMPDIRIYVTADRPLTVFKYNGFNPEVENGIDEQTWPIPSTYTAGLTIKF